MEWLVLVGGTVVFGLLWFFLAVVLPTFSALSVVALIVYTTGVRLVPPHGTAGVIDNGATVLLILAGAIALIFDISTAEKRWHWVFKG